MQVYACIFLLHSDLLSDVSSGRHFGEDMLGLLTEVSWVMSLTVISAWTLFCLIRLSSCCAGCMQQQSFAAQEKRAQCQRGVKVLENLTVLKASTFIASLMPSLTRLVPKQNRYSEGSSRMILAVSS